MLDLGKLAGFVAVAETGSITRAADRLMITAPALSQQLSKLESSVGAQLLIRSNSGCELTAAGRALAGHARDILERADRGHTDVPRLAEGNVAVQVFTTVTKSPRGQNYDQNSAEAGDNITPLFMGQLRPLRSWFSLRERALVQAEALVRAAEAAPDQLRLIRTRADLQAVLDARAGGQRILGAVL